MTHYVRVAKFSSWIAKYARKEEGFNKLSKEQTRFGGDMTDQMSSHISCFVIKLVYMCKFV